MENDNLQEKLILQKLQNEILIQEIDKKIKEKDLKRRIFFEPTSVTIIVALLGVFGVITTSFLQRDSQLVIEEKKFQYSVYQKALEAKDNATAAKVLDFYIKAGLLPGKIGKYSKLLEEGKTDEIPTYNGIYSNVSIPSVDNSNELSISNHFLKGKGTQYLLSYNALTRFKESFINTIILHSSFSPNLKETAIRFADTTRMKISAHILIDRDGKVLQQVPFNYMSHHAKGFNNSSIGIEFINIGHLKKKNKSFVNVYGKIIDVNKDIICNENGECWEKYTDAQIRTGIEICKLLINHYQINSVVSHSELDKTKIDPGPYFPINQFKNLIK